MSTAVHDRFADYVPVSERLEHFYKDYPSGRVLTSIVEHDAEHGFVLIRAEIYRQHDDAMPAATGHAFENRSEGYVNKTSYIENCETSATGRALALLGYEIKRGIASREEMEKTERMGGNGSQPDPAADVPDCPECGGPMWDNRTTKRGKQPDFKCKSKSCNKAVWLPKEPITEGFSQDQVLRDQYFNAAEKLLAGLSEERRKEKLGKLLMLSTEEMGEKVEELARNVRQKHQDTDGELADRSDHEERMLMIEDIKRDAPPDKLQAYVKEHFNNKAWVELTFQEVKQLHDEFVVPF